MGFGEDPLSIKGVLRMEEIVRMALHRAERYRRWSESDLRIGLLAWFCDSRGLVAISSRIVRGGSSIPRIQWPDYRFSSTNLLHVLSSSVARHTRDSHVVDFLFAILAGQPNYLERKTTLPSIIARSCPM